MTTTAPPFRLRAGETDSQYIARMRKTYKARKGARVTCEACKGGAVMVGGAS